MKQRGIWLAIGLATMMMCGATAHAQDDEGDGSEGEGDDTSPVDPGTGIYTRGSYPIAAVTRPLAFGAPPAGVVRLMPRWDNWVFTENAPIGPFGSFSITSWGQTFGLDVDVGPVVLRATVPIGYVRTSNTTGSSSDQAELGDVMLEGLAQIDLGSPEQRLLIGGGIALPTATDPRCRGVGCSATGSTVRGIAWQTGFRNAQAWMDQSFTFWPSIEYRLGVPWVLFSATGTIPIFIPTDSAVGGPLARGNVELMFQLDVSGAVRFLNVVDVGLSFLAWALPSGAGYAPGGTSLDLGQTALTFFARTDPELDAPISGGAEFIVNLDNSWGPTGDTNKIWGLRLFIGGRFDV